MNRGQAFGYYSLIKSYYYHCNRHAMSNFYLVQHKCLTIHMAEKAPWRRELTFPNTFSIR